MKKLTALVSGLLLLDASIVGCGSQTTQTTTTVTSSHGGGGTGGSGPACTDPAKDCPSPSTACVVATCSADGKCATQNAPAGAACADSGGKVCDGNGTCAQCVAASDCPASDSQCATTTCVGGKCGLDNAADGTPISSQIPGDCKREVCDGAGSTKIVDDDADFSDDGNPCTIDSCSAGTNVKTDAAPGAACGSGQVCGTGTKSGACVGCLVDTDCTGGDVCDTTNDNFTCVPPTCQDGAKNGQETGLDCGGPDCGACPNGEACAVAADCASKVCDAGVCAACAADADCAASDFCDTATGVCTADKAGGSACTSASQCQGGQCVDGFCCDTACSGTCEACSAAKKGQGLDGVCGAIASGQDPDDDCATDPASSCGKTGACNGSGACQLFASGTVCATPTCSGGVLQNADTCNGTGVCSDGGSTSCGAYQCNAAGNACLSVCAADSDCAAGSFCNAASQCVTKLTGGAACSGPNQCGSGSCVDGVCCNGACGGVCMACSAVKTGGADGVCAPVVSGSDPDNECAADAASTCGKTGVCDGSGACQLFASGTVCATPACSGGVLQNADTCNGTGVCVDGGSTSCGAYQCNASGNGCLTTCAADSDCASGNYCDASGQCVAQLANGISCGGSNQCANGNCVDGVCCNTACSGACVACTAAKTGSANGVCSNVLAGTDPDNECAGAFSCNGSGACQSCSDGVQNGDETGVDCGGSSCAGCGSTQATAGLSCLDLLQKGSTQSNVYWIKPQGATAAFQVYCDQATSGGGWTALPLRFNDSTMWSISQAGSACVTIAAKDNLGGFSQYFSSNTGTFADTIFKFVPQISVSAVRLVAFNHSPGGTCNSMDYQINGISSGTNTSWESWWFADATYTTARAYTFPDANCPAPYQASGTSYCTRDTNLGAALFPMDRSLTYNASAPLFQMVLRQGCQSALCSPGTDGERFYVATPADADGIWRKGIFVR